MSVLKKSAYLITTIFMLSACGFPSEMANNADNSINEDSGFETTGIFGGRGIQQKDPIAPSVVGLMFKTADGEMRTCTATLITSQILITAAHCVADDLKTEEAFFIDDLGKSTEASQNSRRKIVGSAIAPGYLKAAADVANANLSDLALLRLDSPAPAWARTARLAQTVAEDKLALAVGIVGFGAEGANSETGEIKGDYSLKTAIVPRVPSPWPSILRFDQRRAGVCVGDSGGPAFVLNKEPKQKGQLKSAQTVLVVGVIISVNNPGGAELCRGFSNAVSVVKWKDWIRENTDRLSLL